MIVGGDIVTVLPKQELTTLHQFLSTLLLLLKNRKIKTTFQVMSLGTLLSFRAGLEWFSADAGLLLHQVKNPLYFGIQFYHFCSSLQNLSTTQSVH